MTDAPDASPHLQQTLRAVEDAARNHGRRDRRRKTPRHPCPYRSPRVCEAWGEGWDAQDTEIRSKEMTDG